MPSSSKGQTVGMSVAEPRRFKLPEETLPSCLQPTRVTRISCRQGSFCSLWQRPRRREPWRQRGVDSNYPRAAQGPQRTRQGSGQVAVPTAGTDGPSLGPGDGYGQVADSSEKSYQRIVHGDRIHRLHAVGTWELDPGHGEDLRGLASEGSRLFA